MIPEELSIPADLAAERHLLGGVLLRPELLRPVLDAVEAADMYRPWHARVLEAAARVGVPGDPLQMVKLVHRKLLAQGVHDDDRDSLELLDLILWCPDTRATVAAAARVHALARSRTAMGLVSTAYNRLGDGAPVEDVAPLLLKAAAA